MSSSLDPAQPSSYPQQQSSNNSTNSNSSNSGNSANNSNGRQPDHSHQFNQGPQNQQNQNQNQNQQYPPQQYQQTYYYQGGDYAHPRQQQQQQQQQGFPRYPGGPYSQPSQQQYYHQDPQQQQQQQPQPQRSEDYYRQDHSPPIMAQGKPQQPQQQQYQQQYQPQYQSQQYPPHAQQRHLALNNNYQQPQQQQQNKVLPSPSISLSSDEFQAQRDYNGSGDAAVSASPSISQNQQEQNGETSASVSGASESVEDISSPRFENESSLRFKVTLDAQTAAMQHQGDTPVTYLNKGQFYTITLQDTEDFDGDIHSVIKVTFHEEAHRKLAARYWSFWLSQQAHPKTARALDIEKASSTGMMEVQSKTFDRISFKWNGKAGAKLMVRFNCLSTDFSRIKGVKGIPLRVHMDTALDGAGLDNGNQEQPVERSYAKIKLFRDKGAERKNKDDHKHLEKMWDKMRGKNADTNPLSQVLAPVQSVSVFWECLDHQEDSVEDETLDLSETLAQEPINTDSTAEGDGVNPASEAAAHSEDASGAVSPGESNALVPASKKRRRPNDTGSGSSGGQLGPLYVGEGPGSSDQLLDRDPSYVPQMRRKKQPMLCLYIKIGGEAVYRAVYLERLTLAELTQKLCEKLEIQASTISGVFRKTTKKELMVRVDDSMVAQMTDELDMVVEYDFNQQDGSVNLTLKY